MAFVYEKFDIAEVAVACGIQFYPRQKNSVEIRANCPFCGDTKYHLGLNRELERFHCFRCKEHGNSVSLYAKLHGISNKEAYYALRDGTDRHEFAMPQVNPVLQTPLRPLAERHDVYYDFLQMLNLQPVHREKLTKRGLHFSEIHRFLYKSVPLDRVFRREVLERLSAMHDLEGIPGFYRDSNNDWQMYLKSCGGIFVPVCNKDGYIQGLQMRLDLPEDTKEKKFRWFSSKHFNGGTAAKSWVHVVGDITAYEAILTEGAMKSDIASVLSGGRLFIAVSGVNAVNFLPEVLKELKIRRVYEAFDMDKCYKPEVKDALLALRTLVKSCGVECKACSWNPYYKGIDDYCFAKMQRELQPAVA